MDAYGPCLELRTGKWISKLKRWMDNAMQPTATEWHDRIAPAVLVDRLNEVNDNKWVVQEALGHLCEDSHRF